MRVLNDVGILPVRAREVEDDQLDRHFRDDQRRDSPRWRDGDTWMRRVIVTSGYYVREGDLDLINI
jgi:hypothetical protein